MSMGVVRKCPNKSLLSQANGLVKLQLGKTEEKSILFFNQTPEKKLWLYSIVATKAWTPNH